MIKKLVGIFLVSVCGHSFSASFDCSKAIHIIEKTICADKHISKLDEELSAKFREAIANSQDPKKLLQEQRIWLNAERNNCSNAACLIKVYNDRIAVLREVKKGVNTQCPITEENLLGVWRGVGVTDFEEMAFELSGNSRHFLSWKHHYPEMIGSWSLQDCVIHITDPLNSQLSFDYAVKKYGNRILHLQEDNGKERSVYKKIK